MATFRRDATPGSTWFFTAVTGDRRPWLACRTAIACLREAMATTKRLHPFGIIAAVVLPDHVHMLWQLPEGDAEYGTRWALIKRATAKALQARNAAPRFVPRRSQARRHESGLWQRRFWEHRIRDDADLQRHVDYIHYNPVKHGYAARASDWPCSSIHRYIGLGWIDANWAAEPATGMAGRMGE